MFWIKNQMHCKQSRMQKHGSSFFHFFEKKKKKNWCGICLKVHLQLITQKNLQIVDSLEISFVLEIIWKHGINSNHGDNSDIVLIGIM
jgi:hypothetical protein